MEGNPEDFQQLWMNLTSTTDKPVRTLAEIPANEEGSSFVSRSERKDGELYMEPLDLVSHGLHSPHPSTTDGSPQGITEHDPKTAEKRNLSVTLGHGPIALGGFADVWSGIYNRGPVVIKVVRVWEREDVQKIRQVGIDVDLLGTGLNHPVPAILQGGRSLGNVIPSEHLETCLGLGRHVETAIRRGIRVDGTWEHHGLHQEESRQQTEAGTWHPSPRHFLR